MATVAVAAAAMAASGTFTVAGAYARALERVHLHIIAVAAAAAAAAAPRSLVRVVEPLARSRAASIEWTIGEQHGDYDERRRRRRRDEARWRARASRRAGERYARQPRLRSARRRSARRERHERHERKPQRRRPTRRRRPLDRRSRRSIAEHSRLCLRVGCRGYRERASTLARRCYRRAHVLDGRRFISCLIFCRLLRSMFFTRIQFQNFLPLTISILTNKLFSRQAAMLFRAL